MKLKQIKKWEQKRRQGKTSFIFKVGMIYWGVTVGLIWGIITPLITHGRFSLFHLIAGIIAFPIGGIFWGLIVWNISEKKYQAYLEDPDKFET